MIFNFSLDVAAAQLGFAVLINGFSVFSSRTTRPKAFSGRVDGYMVPGDNRVVATVYPLPLDPDVKDPPSFQMRLMAPPAGETTDEMDLVVIAAHDLEAVRFAKDGPTEVLRHTFTLEETRARPRFLDSRPMDSDAAARDTSRALIAALEMKDAALARQLFAHRFDELALATGLARAEFEDGFMDPLEHAMKASGYSVETAPGSQLEIEPGWGYRVMHVRGPGGAPPVTIRGGGVEVSLGWSVADIDGRPTIVR
jgi:hypothetical protein